MPIPPIPAARLRHHLATLAVPSPTDADLLAQYVASRDDAAFAELVRRHGPAVLAVCRRVTGDRHDADDAFQATFLALARKAHRVQPGDAVGGWLFGAAVRAARKALIRSCRRRDQERTFAEVLDLPDTSASSLDSETVQAVLEEVAKLSPAYRAAVVLCELEGRSRRMAARELGIPEGTLSSRLAAARKQLAARFRDRGLVPGVLAAVAGAASCPVLAGDVARLARVSGTYSPRVLKLSEEVVRTPMLSKWGAVSAVILIAVGFVALAADPPKIPAQHAIEPASPDTSVAGGRLLLIREEGLALLSPEGKELLTKKLGPKDAFIGQAWLSPDGKRMAYLVHFGDSERQPRVMVRDLDGGKFATSIDVNAMYLLWAPDGRALVATSYLAEPWSPLKTEHIRIDLVARTMSKLSWPDDIVPVDWSADGKHVVVIREGPARPTGHLGLMTADGTRVTELTALTLGERGWWLGHCQRLSPDGKKLLFSAVPPGGEDDPHGMTRRLYMLDIATKKKTEVAEVPLNATVFWVCWSPDGKRIAYTWRQRHNDRVKEWSKKRVLDLADVAVETEGFLIVANADGSNAKTIASAKTNNALETPLRSIDWR